MLKTITFLASVTLGILLLTSGGMSDDGRAGTTGAPGENTCVTNCHNTFALNSGSGSVVLGSTNMVNWTYVPGTTYHMTATVSLPGSILFGIGVECLTPAGTNAGQLNITDPASTGIKNAIVLGNSRRNVVHTLGGGAGNGSKVFEFDWVAPSTNIGPVTFYFAGNASNNNGQDSGDRIYNGSQVVNPAVVTGVDELSTGGGLLMYPNPVADQLRLDYAMEDAARVEVTLLDLTGRAVASLVSATRQPGRHSEVIGGMDRFPAGTYVLLACMGERTIGRRVVLGPR